MDSIIRRYRSSRKLLLVTVLTATLLLTAGVLFPVLFIEPESHGALRLNLVYYGVHTPEIDSRIIEAKPEYIIANTPHGVWAQSDGNHADHVLQDVGYFKDAGIKVIGYITAGYEGTQTGGNLQPEWYTLETNKRLIKDMAVIDQVDGIFIDECSAFPDRHARGYLRELTEVAHSFGLITWGNAGQDEFDPWFLEQGGFDLIQTTEKWHGQNLSEVQSKWAHRISVIGSHRPYTAEEASTLTLDAWNKGIAYAYVSLDYTSVPDWLEDYACMLRGERSGQ